MSQRLSKSGTVADSLRSNTRSRSPAILRKRLLLQMTSSVSGRNTTTGRGQSTMPERVAWLTSPSSFSRYFATSFCRRAFSRQNTA